MRKICTNLTISAPILIIDYIRLKLRLYEIIIQKLQLVTKLLHQCLSVHQGEDTDTVSCIHRMLGIRTLPCCTLLLAMGSE